MPSIDSNKRKRLSSLFAAAALGFFAVTGSGYVISRNSDALLQTAALYGVAPAVLPLLWLGADIGVDGGAPLWIAAVNGHKDMVSSLLDHGADIHASDDFALLYAALAGHTDIVALLLARGADVHAQKDAALRWAIDEGHTETEMLLRHFIARKNRQALSPSSRNKGRMASPLPSAGGS